MEPVIIPAGIASDMEEWKLVDIGHAAERDRLVRAAAAAGAGKRTIATAMGLSRTTVYSILGTAANDEGTRTAPADKLGYSP